MAKILAVCTSEKTGVQKQAVPRAEILLEHGLRGDAHARDWHRQVSLLAEESIDRMRAKGLELAPGAFGENLVTRGLDLTTLPVGTQLRIGSAILLEVATDLLLEVRPALGQRLARQAAHFVLGVA